MALDKPDNLVAGAEAKRSIPRIGGNWRYFALFRLLQLSPSYWLAHQEATSGVNPQTVPAQFDLVRQTYALFGPLWEVPFWEWWAARGRQAFAQADFSPPKALTQVNNVPTDASAQAVGSLVVDHFSTPGLPPTLLMAIPLGGGKSAILGEVERLLDASRKHLNSHARYRIIADKTRRETVNHAIRTVQTRAHFRKPLYVVGNRAGVADYLKTDDDKSSGYGDERRTMAIVVSRQIKRAHLWAENAARGRFPCLTPPAADKDWPSFQFDELEERLTAYAESSLAALELIPPEKRTSEPRYAGRNWTTRW